MPQVNLGQIGSLFRNLPGSSQQITQAISRGFGSIPSATRQLAPGASRMQQGLPNAIIPGKLSIQLNPVNFLPSPPRSPFPGEGIFKATRTGLTNLRNTAEAAIDTGRGVTNILGRAAGPSIPTALNPFATRSPGTVLGKIGKAFNPLNPVNLRNSAAGAAVNLLPIGAKNQATLQGAITLGGLTPLGVVGAIAANDIYNPLGLTDSQETRNIANSRNNWRQSQAGDPNIKNGYGEIWAGKNYGFQSPESFNKLFGANLPTTPGSNTLNFSSAPPAPTLPPPPGGPAAERAYQAERSSVAQQSAQNPELQRYQDQATLARQALQGYNPASGPLPGAAQTAQDMGMAIWAKKYGPGSNNDLASKVRQGQSGFGAIQNTLAGSAANTGFQSPSQLLTTPPPPVTPTPFPTAIPQSGFQIPGAPTADQLSSYPQFDPTKLDIGPFAKFMKDNLKK